MSKLTETLEGIGCFKVEAAELRIGRTTHEAAFYRQVVLPLPGARNQEPHEVEAVYVLGEIPAAYARDRRTCFRLDGDDRDWYVTTWADAKVVSNPEFAQSHPLGVWFQLRPWDTTDGTTIDMREPKPYQRIQVGVKRPCADCVELAASGQPNVTCMGVRA